MGILKTIYNEAEYREEIARNPTSKIGILRERSDNESGTFTTEEMRKLFPSDGLGAWKMDVAYTCFFFAANLWLSSGRTSISTKE